ncbi:MAG: hybrid sensor histidine kinase/response regulator [Sandaracinaceae bacterium]|nr:hybrid sensor histidine kinase/response regulator [Sandaracinaceae bacterium]
MSESLDYHAYPILYVDDEPANLVALRFALEDQFTIVTAKSGHEALEILKQLDRNVAVLLSDQRMPGMTGVELCELAKKIRPDTVRMIVTAYADLHAVMDAINRGQVSRYIAKPWRNDDLEEILRNAIHVVHVQRTVRDMEMRLLRGTASQSAFTIHTEIAHEIANVLTVMKVSAESAQDHLHASQRTEDAARVRALVEVARACVTDATTAIDQLEGLVGRLRLGDSSRRAQVERCDATRAVDTTMRIVRSEIEKTSRVQVVVDGSPTVRMDHVSLGQVVLNLLMNASQAIAHSEKRDHLVTVRISVEAEQGVITVSDSGPGIPDGLLERIFDPGVTTKPSGSGLGLAIVRDLVTRAGGTILASNGADGGAVFTVRLQIAS